MKKCYLNLLAFVCCASLLTGCGKDSSATEEAISSTEADFSEALNYDPADYVKLGDYKKLKVQYPLPYVSDEDMQMYIYDLMDEATEYRETEDAAKSGDYVLGTAFSNAAEGSYVRIQICKYQKAQEVEQNG